MPRSPYRMAAAVAMYGEASRCYGDRIRWLLAICVGFGCSADHSSEEARIAEAAALLASGRVLRAEQIVEAPELALAPRAQFLNALIAHLKKDRGAYRMIEALPSDSAADVLAEMERLREEGAPGSVELLERAWHSVGQPDLRTSRLLPAKGAKPSASPLALERWPLPSPEDLAAHVERDFGLFDAIAYYSLEPEGHGERQETALRILRWIPLLLFGGSALFAVVLGRRSQSWSPIRRRRSVRLLLGAALAIPPLSTLIALYPLFFSIARPETGEIAAATSEAMNQLMLGVLLDVALLALFLVSRATRR